MYSTKSPVNEHQYYDTVQLIMARKGISEEAAQAKIEELIAKAENGSVAGFSYRLDLALRSYMEDSINRNYPPTPCQVTEKHLAFKE